MIAANGGMASATTETTTAAVAEYRSRTAQDNTNRPMQTVMSTKYRRRSNRDGGFPAEPSGSCPSSSVGLFLPDEMILRSGHARLPRRKNPVLLRLAATGFGVRLPAAPRDRLPS